MELNEHPFLKELSPEDKKLLLSLAHVFAAPPETILFDEQSNSDGLYLLLEGSVAFSKRQSDGTHRFVNSIKAGSCFGETGVITNQPRSARATTLCECRYAILSQEVLKPLISSASSVVLALIGIVTSHLSATTRNYLRDIAQQENLAELGTLVNSVLHDFKNPFMLVTLNTQLLAQLHPDSRTQEICRNVEAQIERMAAMAAEIGEFSRGGERASFSKVNLRELAETFNFLNSPLFEQTGTTIEYDVPAIEVEAEPRKLLRILQNLVGNAVDALKIRVNGKIRIEARLAPEGHLVILRISDNGPGIPASLQKHFWEPFFTHGKAEGTGLGSSIAKAFVEAHSGTIQFQSSSAGTVFTIVLPLRQNKTGATPGKNLLNAILSSSVNSITPEISVTT